MASFELQGPDGATYEVEAPDEGAAIAAFRKMGGGAAGETAPAGDGRANGALNAAARGVVSGVPIVGPALLSGLDRADAAVRSLTGDTRYSDELAAAGRYGDRLRAEHPIATTAGEVVGGVAGTAPLVVARAGASMVTGAALGAADGAARGQDVREAGAIGAAMGAGAPVFGAGIGRVFGAVANRVRPTPVPTTPELKAAAEAAYQRAENAGVQISEPAFAQGMLGVDQAVRSAGFNAKLYPKAAAALEELQGAVGTAPRLQDVELLRRVAKGAAGSIEPAERRIASIIVRGLDDFTARLSPADVVAGDAGTGLAALKEGRDLWGRYSRARTLETGMDRAERAAQAAGRDPGTATSMRQNVSRILNNESLSRSFSAEEREAMEAIVKGSLVENVLRKAGKAAPGAGPLQSLGSVAATVHDPRFAAVPIAGTAAQILSGGLERAKVGRLAEMVRNGGAVAPSQASIEARRRAEILARALAAPAPVLVNQRR